MQKHQAEFMKVVKEYNQQINMLLGMAQTANRRQTEILNRLKGSLQKLTMQQNEFKRYIANPVKYNALLQPYISLLEQTKQEIQKAGEKRES